MQQRLVIASLELVGDDEETIHALTELLLNFCRREAIKLSLIHLLSMIVELATERHNSLILAVAFLQQFVDFKEVVYRSLDTGSADHAACLSTNLLCDRSMEMLYHDFSLLFHGLWLTFHIIVEFLHGLFTVKFGIVFNRFLDAVITTVCCVVLQHIKDKAFINGLLH